MGWRDIHVHLQFTWFRSFPKIMDSHNKLLCQLTAFIWEIYNTADRADEAEDLKTHHEKSSDGMIDPTAEESVRNDKLSVQVPRSVPHECLTDKLRESDDVIND